MDDAGVDDDEEGEDDEEDEDDDDEPEDWWTYWQDPPDDVPDDSHETPLRMTAKEKVGAGAIPQQRWRVLQQHPKQRHAGLNRYRAAVSEPQIVDLTARHAPRRWRICWSGCRSGGSAKISWRRCRSRR